MVQFSVIIPVYRDWDRLSLCLQALERQTFPADQFEIIIANNEPTAHHPFERLPANARVIHEPRPGSYLARNAAVAQSKGTYLAFTDSDCVPDARWLESGLSALEANPLARLTGPINLFRVAPSQRYAFLLEMHIAFPQLESVRDGTCVTANLLVAREVFDRVGPFDECLSGGDTRWNMRATDAGVPILYDANVAVGHPARRTLAEIFRKRRRVAGSRAILRSESPSRYVAQRLKPPLRRLQSLWRTDLSRTDATVIFFVIWAYQLAESHEYALVRLGRKQPNRA